MRTLDSVTVSIAKEFTNLPTAPANQDDGRRMENIERVSDSDIVSYALQSAEAVENLKMKERPGMLQKTKLVTRKMREYF
jgi:hypothetical protein